MKLTSQLNLTDGTEDSQRLDAEVATVTALKELMEIARHAPVSYPEAMEVGAAIIPMLLSKEVSLLQRADESPEAKFYRERAVAESRVKGKNVKPESLIAEEIRKLDPLIGVSGTSNNIRRKVRNLQRLLTEMQDRPLPESVMIQRDVFQSERNHLPSPKMAAGVEKYFPLSKGRSLRLRLLHPNRAEHICGADLVYEVCDEETEKARFAFVQYKVWDKERIPFSKIDEKQLKRMRETLCKKKFCNRNAKAEGECFRMPFCSAFLRLTNKLQSVNSRLISVGRFTPICMLDITGRGTLTRQDILGKDVSSALFEPAFIEGVAGSDWMSFETVERLYNDCEIMTADDRLVIYAQEFVSR